MSKRLASLFVLASLAGLACSGPTGLRAQGSLSVHGGGAAPFGAVFEFPPDTALDGRSGLSAMCTISQGVDGTANGVVLDLIVPATATGPLESVSIMARAGATSGTIEAEVRGRHYSNGACAYDLSFVESDGSVQIRTDGACALDDGAGAIVDANVDLIVRDCTVIGG